MTLRGRFYPGPPVALAFPIEDGWHYVAHGGASTLLNYHHRNRAQRYALDIDALGRLGRRADGLYPRNLQRYVAFGQTVSSPCDGRVTAAEDGHPDQAPHTSDREHPMGNHVVIACQDALVLLAHLRAGSVAARADANVRRGQRLGEIGNSGNTSEPHLHIHAVRAGSGTVEDGEGVPVVFDGRFLTRNATRQ
jgi:murein DD-endopeptidase MepM/ murein hydrolase activator NlpD